MKKHLRHLALFLFFIFMIPLYGSGEESKPALSLETDHLELAVGDSIRLSYSLEAPLSLGKPKLEWSSLEPEICEVNNGIIRAKQAGKTQVWLEAVYGDGTTFSAGAKVETYISVKSITSETKNITVGVNFTSEAIPVSVNPEEARCEGIVWSSENEEIARVDQDGKVTGVSTGKTKITAVTAGPVSQKGKRPELAVNVTVVQLAESVELDPDQVTVAVGKTVKIQEKVLPENTGNKKVSWESDDPSIASAANGNVKGTAPGSTVIRAVAADGSGKLGECVVTVIVPVKKLSLKQKNLTLTAGQPVSVPLTVEPDNATNPEITWTSSDLSVAAADENGRLLGLKEGTCTLTADAADGCGASAKLTVTVEPYIDLTKMQHVTLSVGMNNVLGIREDGTVIAAGNNEYGEGSVKGWTDIVSVSAGWGCSLGLQSNGHVVAAGRNRFHECDVENWKGIIAVSTGGDHSVGLKSDGTVTAVGLNDNGQCNVSGWRDIVAIDAGIDRTIGIRKDGTVVATGSNVYGQCNVSSWRDIVAVSAGKGSFVTVGLQKNGRVVWTGGYSRKYDEVLNRTEEWRNIVSIQSCYDGIIGVDRNGKVYTANISSFPDGKYILAYKCEYNLNYICMLEDGTVSSEYEEINGVKLRLPDGGPQTEEETEEEGAYTGIWIIGDYVNKSGNATGQHYVGTMRGLQGSYSNSGTADANLTVVMMYDRKTDESELSGIREAIGFDLYLKDGSRLSNPTSRMRYGTLTVLDRNNKKYKLEGYLGMDSERFFLSKESIPTLLKILKNGGSIGFILTFDDTFLEQYEFAIPDADGFETVFDRYIRTI